MSDEPCDGCASRATHFLCDECCAADIDRLAKERDEARAEAKELREILETAGQRLKACGYELTEFSYQELASVLLDLPSREGEP